MSAFVFTAQGERALGISFADCSWAAFFRGRGPEPAIRVLRGYDDGHVRRHGRSRPAREDDLALLDATPAGRAWRAEVEGAGR